VTRERVTRRPGRPADPIQHDEERHERDGTLLREEREQERDAHREAIARATAVPQRAVVSLERDQSERGDEQLAARRDPGRRLGLDRMHRAEQRRTERDAARRAGRAHDPEDEHGDDREERERDRVRGQRARTEERAVHREREHHERAIPARSGAGAGPDAARPEQRPRAQILDERIALDLPVVVVDEAAEERRREGRERGGGDDGRERGVAPQDRSQAHRRSTSAGGREGTSARARTKCVWC
jgi:hypothetical protein